MSLHGIRSTHWNLHDFHLLYFMVVIPSMQQRIINSPECSTYMGADVYKRTLYQTKCFTAMYSAHIWFKLPSNKFPQWIEANDPHEAGCTHVEGQIDAFPAVTVVLVERQMNNRPSVTCSPSKPTAHSPASASACLRLGNPTHNRAAKAVHVYIML